MSILIRGVDPDAVKKKRKPNKKVILYRNPKAKRIVTEADLYAGNVIYALFGSDDTSVSPADIPHRQIKIDRVVDGRVHFHFTHDGYHASRLMSEMMNPTSFGSWSTIFVVA